MKADNWQLGNYLENLKRNNFNKILKKENRSQRHTLSFELLSTVKLFYWFDVVNASTQIYRNGIILWTLNNNTLSSIGNVYIFNIYYKSNKIHDNINLLVLDINLSLLDVVQSVEDGGHTPGLYWVWVSAERSSPVSQLRQTWGKKMRNIVIFLLSPSFP